MTVAAALPPTPEPRALTALAKPSALAFIDIETTGLDPFRHEMIEVAVVRADLLTLEIEAEYSSLVAPRRPQTATAEALAINGFSPVEWQGAPALRDVMPRVDEVLEGAVPAGHNVGFDLSFLEVARWRLHLQEPQFAYHRVDTVALAWVLRSLGEADGLSLDAVTAALDVPRRRPHRALDDARAALEVARRFRERVRLAGRLAKLPEDQRLGLLTLIDPVARS